MNKTQHANPFHPNHPIKDPHYFIGRTDILKTIANAFRLMDNVSLCAEPRMGKTSLLYYVAHKKTAKRLGLTDNNIPVYINFQDLATLELSDKLWLTIFEKIEEEVQQRCPKKKKTATQALNLLEKATDNIFLLSVLNLEEALNILQNANLKIHILFDNFELSYKNPIVNVTFYEILDSLKSKVDNISYVITACTRTPNPNFSRDIIAFFDTFIAQELGVFQEYEVHELLVKYFDIADIDTEFTQKLQVGSSFLSEATGYHPHLLQILGHYFYKEWDKAIWPQSKARKISLKAFELANLQDLQKYSFIKNLESPYGTVPLNSKFYIEREADDDYKKIIGANAGTFTIEAPRQMGKSSLMIRILDWAERTQNKTLVFIDLQGFPKDYFKEENEEAFLKQFCRMIAEELQILKNIDEYWAKSSTAPIFKCDSYLKEYILPAIGNPFILALDEVDSILFSPFGSNFFGLLRTWHNGRGREEGLEKMSILLSSSTETDYFIDSKQSPFNVAHPIHLQDFSKANIEELNKRHHFLLDQAQLDTLFDLIGGHPFLNRLAFYLLATNQCDFEALLDQEQAIKDTGPFANHLRYHKQKVLGDIDLMEAMKKVTKEQTYQDLKTFHRLKGLGLVKQIDQDIVFSNKLYASYFSRLLK